MYFCLLNHLTSLYLLVWKPRPLIFITEMWPTDLLICWQFFSICTFVPVLHFCSSSLTLFLCLASLLYLCVSSFSSIVSSILCRAGLVDINYFDLFLSWEVFLSLSTVLYSFAEYIHLGWHLWSFRTWNTLIPGSSGLLSFSWEIGSYFDSFCYCYYCFDLWFFSCSSQHLSVFVLYI